MKTANFFFVLILSLFVVASAWADAPQVINYQGKLFNSEGAAIADGNYAITFSIFDDPAAGVLKWTETQNSVAVADGLFQVVMGSLTSLPDSVFNGEGRYLELNVNGQALAPRTQFTSVSYAHRISTVDGATAGELSGSLKIIPDDFSVEGNALTVVDAADNTVAAFSVNELGKSSIALYDGSGVKAAANTVLDLSVSAEGLGKFSMYDPADSFDKAAVSSIDLSVQPGGFGKLSFYDPTDSFNKAALNSIDLSVGADGLGKLSFYEPSDSKLPGLERVKITKDGLIMFGETEADTSLIIENDGDIVGLGQITMGQNSSDGINTAVLGYNNDASGDSSSIGGGSFNVTSGVITTIGGGHSNTASGEGATVGGGSFNDASGDYSTIAGGNNNQTIGNFGTIPGGDLNSANGFYSFSAGHRAKAEHNGAFVWADQTDSDFGSTGDDQFIVRAGGGVGINTNAPTGLLDVVGSSGDGSVNLPGDAISSPEIFDEPGLASNRNTVDIVLPQTDSILLVDPNMQDLAVATITIPGPGYLVVRGGGTLKASGSSGPNQAIIQIDDTQGGAILAPYYTLSGSGDHDSPNKFHYFSMTVERIYTKTAGTYEFRLEGRSSPENGGSAVTTIVNPYITVLFFPTAYGTVYSSQSP